MTMNKRPHNKHTPYLLVVAGRQHGAYASASKASEIGRSLRLAYKVYDLNDNVVDSSD